MVSTKGIPLAWTAKKRNSSPRIKQQNRNIVLVSTKGKTLAWTANIMLWHLKIICGLDGMNEDHKNASSRCQFSHF